MKLQKHKVHAGTIVDLEDMNLKQKIDRAILRVLVSCILYPTCILIVESLDSRYLN